MTTTNTLKDKGGNWLVGTVDGLEVQAKVYAEPNYDYGMEQDARISKLWVALPATATAERVCLYNYDRGPDAGTNHLKDETLDMIVAAVASKIR